MQTLLVGDRDSDRARKSLTYSTLADRPRGTLTAVVLKLNAFTDHEIYASIPNDFFFLLAKLLCLIIMLYSKPGALKRVFIGPDRFEIYSKLKKPRSFDHDKCSCVYSER